MATTGSLDVVALISGGKDSFFSLLHCLEQGHRVVALANLHPPSSTRLSSDGSTPVAQHRPPHGSSSGSGSLSTTTTTNTTAVNPELATAAVNSDSRNIDSSSYPEAPPESDLNSFMYQTVGHQTIPLYARATGLPLFRQPIHGSALDHGISYSPDGHHRQTGERQGEGKDDDDDEGHDETESLVPLLRAVMKACPSVNAVSTGAILSTYQRTRVESVAIRLGLVPLGYLWQYPDLPRSLLSSPAAVDQSAVDDAQLLRDMAHTGLEARIIKVASAGLDEGLLWENVASDTGIARIQRGLRKFGGGGKGAVLGEGGEFETLVVDGPPELFKGRIVVREDDRQVVREGGGSEWLLIRRAEVEMKTDLVGDATPLDQRSVPTPALLDDKFEAVLEACGRQPTPLEMSDEDVLTDQSLGLPAGIYAARKNSVIRTSFINETGDVQQQTERIVRDIRSFLAERSLEAIDILNSIVVLRHMSDFPAINKLYGSLFTEANPPSRVTISSGSQLPEECQIAIHLVVQSAARRGHRKGLHVQSRSYWAPANIGPYSQAISYPLMPESSTSLSSNQDGVPPSCGQSALTAVSIAGQIPLVPATMEFPPPSITATPAPDATQITLALQHLWRVGVAMDVVWWTSVVAYFPASSSSSAATTTTTTTTNTTAAEGSGSSSSVMAKNSIAAAAAWREAHVWSPVRARTTDNNDGTGPDLWDKRYNAQYQSFSAGGNDSAGEAAALPRWNMVDGFADHDDGEHDEDEDEDMYSADVDGSGQDEREQAQARKRDAQRGQKGRCMPYVFAAEVEQLPRSAGVEWHAHIGLAAGGMRAAGGVVRVFSSLSNVPHGNGGNAEGEYVVELHHVAVTTPTTGGSTTDYNDDNDDDGESGKAKAGTYLHTTAVLRRRGGDGSSDASSDGKGADDGKMAFGDAGRHVRQAYSAAVDMLIAAASTTMQEADVSATGGQHGGTAAGPDPYLVYTDAAAILDPLGSTGVAAAAAAAAAVAVVPCHSLHDGRGRRLAAVALFETFLVAA